MTLHQKATQDEPGMSVPGPDRASCDEHSCSGHGKGHSTVVAMSRWEQEPEKSKAEAHVSEADWQLRGHLCVSHSKMVTVVKFQYEWRPWNQVTDPGDMLECEHQEALLQGASSLGTNLIQVDNVQV